MKKIITLAVAAAGLLLPAAAVGQRTFNHPGLSYSADDILQMKRQIATKSEPAYSTFEALKSSGYSALTPGTPDPVTAIAEGKFNNTIGVDGRKAHDLALLYVLTNDSRYADEALKHINRYTGLTNCSARGTAPLDNGKIYLMLEAAELLRDYKGWSTADREQFEAMLVYPGYSTTAFPDSHYSLDDSANDITFYWNIYNFDPTRWGNQGLFAARALMAMGIFLDNELMYERALRYVRAQESRPDDLPYRKGYPARGAMNSESEYLDDYKFTWKNGDTGFIGDEAIPYYIYANGQCQEACRDQGHVMAGLGQLVDLAEMAWHQGDDLYADFDHRILLGAEWALRYNLSAIEGTPWEPEGYVDHENGCTFDNGMFFRADSRSQRWHALKPYDGDRESALGNVRYLNQLLAHYHTRTELLPERYEWVQRAVDHMGEQNGGVENWGASGHHYEWKGWGTLTKPLTLFATGVEGVAADSGAEPVDRSEVAVYDLAGRPAGTLADMPVERGMYVTMDGDKILIK